MTSPTPNPASALEWFQDDRFGLFLHWGLYALPARHEWVKSREKLTDAHYDRYFRHFDPDLFDPAGWARMAREAGMRYFVITTKHHEGFCLWDSELTDYKVTNTPYGRDLIAPMVEAFRAEGLRVGFYHSLIDWHHPDFPVDGLHPRRDDEEFKAANAGRDMAKYTDYLHGQVRELLTRFGQIDYLFFDFSYPGREWGGKGVADWRSEELLKLVRDLQPDILVNDRLEIPGDFVTPEQYQPSAPMQVDGQPVAWEACQTLNGSWGYDRDNLDWKPTDLLVRMLVDSVSKDGNLLLNVGPNGRGEFEPRAVERLRGIGEWARLHGRSVYGAGRSEFTPPADCRYTQRGDRLYVHVFGWPFKHLHLPGLAGRVDYAQFLHDASEVGMRVIEPAEQAQNTKLGGLPEHTLTLELPVQRPEVAVPVIELFLTSP
ncbi:alpha-L-fucosidase [Fodinicola acaciae]|uniref:alpha-L-fucosidase n=1 Tax=Fodinicola acaciae TaxID=2681555 RepID=UPI0013CFB306|nr:alpha-L-fucosidase [Fodinicola acaciae]